jgi:ATP-dependent protease HslVU (ClpYQ) peptidase subunit
MSVVICEVKENKICLAADSRLSNCGNLRPGLTFDKIRKIGNVFVGSVGTCQEIQILFNYISKNKPPNNSEELVMYMGAFYKFRNEVNSKLEPEDKDCLSEGQYILVMNKKAYAVTNLFASAISTFHAVGSGEQYALGAMEAKASIVKSVEIACKYDSGCGLPVQYVEVKI